MDASYHLHSYLHYHLHSLPTISPGHGLLSMFPPIHTLPSTTSLTLVLSTVSSAHVPSSISSTLHSNILMLYHLLHYLLSLAHTSSTLSQLLMLCHFPSVPMFHIRNHLHNLHVHLLMFCHLHPHLFIAYQHLHSFIDCYLHPCSLILRPHMTISILIHLRIHLSIYNHHHRSIWSISNRRTLVSQCITSATLFYLYSIVFNHIHVPLQHLHNIYTAMFVSSTGIYSAYVYNSDFSFL